MVQLTPIIRGCHLYDERVIFRLALAGPGAPAPTTRTNIIEDAAAVDYTRLHTIASGALQVSPFTCGTVRLYNIERDPSESRIWASLLSLV